MKKENSSIGVTTQEFDQCLGINGMMIKGKDKYGLKNCMLMMRQKGRFTNVMWEKKGVCGLKIDKEEWWGQEIKVEECNTD